MRASEFSNMRFLVTRIMPPLSSKAASPPVMVLFPEVIFISFLIFNCLPSSPSMEPAVSEADVPDSIEKLFELL